MWLCIKYATLFLVAMSVFSPLPSAEGACSGSCAVSSGGGSSYDFMGDSAFNIGMSSFDEFVRDNIGRPLLSARKSQNTPLGANKSLNQTADNASQTRFGILPAINNLGNTTSDGRPVKLGASALQDKRVSTLVFTTFNNKF
ncbi:Uncharacterised protein [uncultured archaeon]|nr:Uncharacterised protein [uncultured archaeon]